MQSAPFPGAHAVPLYLEDGSGAKELALLAAFLLLDAGYPGPEISQRCPKRVTFGVSPSMCQMRGVPAQFQLFVKR